MVLGAIWVAPSTRPPNAPPEGEPPHVSPRRAEDLAGPHLARAERQCRAAIEPPVRSVERFFHDARQRTPPFVEEALGWGSKWRLVVDHVPYTRGGRHETYLRERFDELVFSPSQLLQAVESAVSDYLAEVRSLEGRMLVDLRADMADVPGEFPRASLDEAEFRKLYDESLALVAQSSGGSLQAEVGTQLVSFITGEVLAAVAVRLGVSAGLLSAGATTSWATLGVGLVVSVIVDQIVSWVWDWYADPKGDLTQELNRKLDVIRRMMVDGSGGLRDRLEAFAEQRAVVRREAVLQLLEKGS